jgi:hypothetical protein
MLYNTSLSLSHMPSRNVSVVEVLSHYTHTRKPQTRRDTRVHVTLSTVSSIGWLYSIELESTWWWTIWWGLCQHLAQALNNIIHEERCQVGNSNRAPPECEEGCYHTLVTFRHVCYGVINMFCSISTGITPYRTAGRNGSSSTLRKE